MTNAEVYAQGKTSIKSMASAMFRHRRAFVATVSLILGTTLVVALLQYAAPPPTHSAHAAAPSLMTIAMIGGFIAVFLGLCVIVFAEKGRDTLSSPQELESISSHPVLATVPFKRGLDEVCLLEPLRTAGRAMERPIAPSPRTAPLPPPPAKISPTAKSGNGHSAKLAPASIPVAAVVAEIKPPVEPQAIALPPIAQAAPQPETPPVVEETPPQVAPMPASAEPAVVAAEPAVVVAAVEPQSAPVEAAIPEPRIEPSQWEMLRTVMTQLPAGSSPAVTPSAVEMPDEALSMMESAPLLKRPKRHESAIITRSTVDHFPLPSVVPGAPPPPIKTAQPSESIAPEPVAAPAPVAEPAQFVEPIATPAAAPVIAPIAAEVGAVSAAEPPVSQFARYARPIAAPSPEPPREASSAPPAWGDRYAEEQKQLEERRAASQSHRPLATLRQQFLREQTSADLPDDTAQAARSTTEVARNENGEIDYVTFTFNVAPRVERRGRAR